MEKYLHVSFMVRQQNLYDLLHALEEHKVGNVEVRAVSRMLNGAAEEPDAPQERHRVITTKRGTRTMGVRDKLRKFMKLDEPHNYTEMARKFGFNPKSVATAMLVFQQEGVVRKVKPGIYMRIKEDA